MTKIQRLLISTMFVASLTNAYPQYKNYVGAGSTLSNKRYGFYVGVSSFGKLTDIVSVGTDLQIMKEDLFYSINGTFGAKVSIVGYRLSVFAGPRFGMVLNYSFKDDEFEPARVGGTVGLNYAIQEFEITARLYQDIKPEWRTFCLGINYKLNN